MDRIVVEGGQHVGKPTKKQSDGGPNAPLAIRRARRKPDFSQAAEG